MALGSRTAILEQQLRKGGELMHIDPAVYHSYRRADLVLTESLGFPVADRAASRERGLLPATKQFDV